MTQPTTDDTAPPQPGRLNPAFRGPLIRVPARAVPLYVFLHIQKTAGTTIRHVFKRMFGPHYFLVPTPGRPLTPDEEPWTSDRTFYNDKLMLAGHFGIDHEVVAQIRHRRPVFVSLLRDPVRRVVSLYDYHRRREPASSFDRYVAGTTLLRAVSDPGPFRAQIDNHQLRVLFGPAWRDARADQLARHPYLIGTTDHLDKFVDAVAAISNLRRPPKIPTFNTIAHQQNQSVAPVTDQPGYEEALAVIRAMNQPEYDFIADYLQTGLLLNVPTTPANREPVA